MEVLDRALEPVVVRNIARAYAIDLLLGQHLLVEVVDHDLGLEADRVVVPLDIAPELLAGLPDVELTVVLHRLGELARPKSHCPIGRYHFCLLKHCARCLCLFVRWVSVFA